LIDTSGSQMSEMEKVVGGAFLTDILRDKTKHRDQLDVNVDLLQDFNDKRRLKMH
jgi:hypothetical protein